MKREYDVERRTFVSTCSHCHYKYANVDWEQRKSDEGNEPFIEMREMMHQSDGWGGWTICKSRRLCLPKMWYIAN